MVPSPESPDRSTATSAGNAAGREREAGGDHVIGMHGVVRDLSRSVVEQEIAERVE
jgi:hypothetical protein